MLNLGFILIYLIVRYLDKRFHSVLFYVILILLLPMVYFVAVHNFLAANTLAGLIFIGTFMLFSDALIERIFLLIRGGASVKNKS